MTTKQLPLLTPEVIKSYYRYFVVMVGDEPIFTGSRAAAEAFAAGFSYGRKQFVRSRADD